MRNVIGLFLISTLIMALGCKSEYTRSVEKELASGIINDSLIFGMKMGQTKKDFFRICWDLNKSQMISEGPGNMTAKFIEPVDSTKEISLRKEMLFYGIFDQHDTMRGMDMLYSYSTYAPWILKSCSDSLMVDLKNIYLVNYPGNDYIEIDLNLDKYKAYSKIDGNRRILIYPKNQREVVVKIEDLRHEIKN